MTTETIDVLLERDIDDLTAAAGRLRADERNTLLVSQQKHWDAISHIV